MPFNLFGQTKVNEIKIFEGKFNSYFMLEGEISFQIDTNLIFIQAGILDNSKIKCKVDKKLNWDMLDESLEGMILKVKVKAVYVNYTPFGIGNSYKKLIWKPIEIMAK